MAVVGLARVGAMPQQQLDHAQVAALSGDLKRGRAIVARGVRVGAPR